MADEPTTWPCAARLGCQQNCRTPEPKGARLTSRAPLQIGVTHAVLLRPQECGRPPLFHSRALPWTLPWHLQPLGNTCNVPPATYPLHAALCIP